MLRILEAMGILALLTRQTPKDIADERERMQELLKRFDGASNQARQQMLAYVWELDTRLLNLPAEVEKAIDPEEIAKLLGESLRQHFLQSGMTETVRALQASSAAFVTAQQQLSSVLHTVADPRYGIMAQVEEANRRLTLSLEVRAKAIDELLHNLKTAFLHVWAPLLCGASLILGLILGMGLQGWKDSQATASPIAPQSESQLMLDEERQEPDVPHNKLKKPIQKRPRATFPVDQNH